MKHRGIVARVCLSPATELRGVTLAMLAAMLYAMNAAWLKAQRDAGKHPPLRLLLAEPPWCARPIVYVRHHGEAPRARVRDYYDGPTALHHGVATCIDIASYDAAAMSVIEGRDATPAMLEPWPDAHFGVREGKRFYDTTSHRGALASLRAEDRCRFHF